ncbi:class I adenylate cyclase, partial [Klebsiella pneumoniae]|uniref:class I adenylate cyclase n=1 Tax=Klebsiella pneumoniae TaxID=573 RepID=UPI000E36475B
ASAAAAEVYKRQLDESTRAEGYHHCEGSKEELVRDVSRFYSSSHDRFTYGSSFINFNLPQFYPVSYTHL